MAKLSRREVLTAGAAGATTVVLSGPALASTGDDAAVLRRAIRIEREAELAYAEIARSPQLPGWLTHIARQFGRQEQAHADALIKALGHLGGTPPPTPSRVPGLDKALAGSQRQIAQFAVSLELRAVRGYHQAASELNDSKLLMLIATIMASEGQHLAVLRGTALRENPVPHAFETGEPR